MKTLEASCHGVQQVQDRSSQASGFMRSVDGLLPHKASLGGVVEV